MTPSPAAAHLLSYRDMAYPKCLIDVGSPTRAALSCFHPIEVNSETYGHLSIHLLPSRWGPTSIRHIGINILGVNTPLNVQQSLSTSPHSQSFVASRYGFVQTCFMVPAMWGHTSIQCCQYLQGGTTLWALIWGWSLQFRTYRGHWHH